MRTPAAALVLGRREALAARNGELPTDPRGRAALV